MIYYTNMFAYAVACIYIVYFLFGGVLCFFKYKTLFNRMYPNHPIVVVLLILSVAQLIVETTMGISSVHYSFGTIVIITMLIAYILVLGYGIFGNVAVKLYNRIKTLRDNLPER
ncbi:TPA: hypothetical protein IHJ80_004615 [Escherichia coli]|nr:hypothetical protein [Escherichia coli]